MSYSLVIIDMQVPFYAALERKTQRACIREIEKAIRDKAVIIFVEYQHHGPTLPILTDVVKKANYRRVHYLTKEVDDGSTQVIELLREKHLPILNLRVCGVNTRACVYTTIRGLSLKLPNSTIKLISDACNCFNEKTHLMGLVAIRYYPNTVLLRAPGLA